MILVEIRSTGQRIELHRRLTVIGGLDEAQRRQLLDGLGRVLRGDDTEYQVVVEVDGKRSALTPGLAKEIGVSDSLIDAVIRADHLPRTPARPQPQPRPEQQDRPPAQPVPAQQPPPAGQPEQQPPDQVAVEANVTAAESRVAEARAVVDRAVLAHKEAQSAMLEARKGVDAAASAQLANAESRLEVARAAVAGARRELDAAQARTNEDRESKDAQNKSANALNELQSQRAELESARAVLLSTLAELGQAADPAPIEEALAGLRRLRQVKPKPSARAAQLADQWVTIQRDMSSLSAPPSPPEWLVQPALAALQEAREALALAEDGGGAAADPTKTKAIEDAHYEVLDAEERVMRKSSRINRRRLEQAQQAERAALEAQGVSSYGEYLQRSGGRPADHDPAAQARAALADAEAVWEELHGGLASPEWTAAKEAEAKLKAQAIALLGKELPDDQLEAALRDHLETVVDATWAQESLSTALAAAGVAVGDGDIEAVAETWLAAAPEIRTKREEVTSHLTVLDERLAALDEQVATIKSDAFFGTEPAPDARPAAEPVADAATDELGPLRATLADAEAAERAAEAALEEAKKRVGASNSAGQAASDFEAKFDAAQKAVDDARAQLQKAEEALSAARKPADRPPAPPPAPVQPVKDPPAPPQGQPSQVQAVKADGAAPAPPSDSAQRLGLEAELFLVARAAGLATEGAACPRPLIIEGTALAGADADRVRRLLDRLSTATQVVVVGEDDRTREWVRRLGGEKASAVSG